MDRLTANSFANADEIRHGEHVAPKPSYHRPLALKVDGVDDDLGNVLDGRVRHGDVAGALGRDGSASAKVDESRDRGAVLRAIGAAVEVV